MNTVNLTDISGIALATLFLVQILKSLFLEFKINNRIPIIIYVMITSLGLTYLCSKGDILHGRLIELLLNSMFSAISSSGMYSWTKD